ncbi:MAG TPA: hypothetical protein PLO23_05590, partial [Alphaproteobacteria bacterium]|nr:hypothetical protein [Alphaproteobacteria bacterium]
MSSDHKKAPDDTYPQIPSDPPQAGQSASGQSKAPDPEVPDEWPLQADRMAMHRPLVDSLVMLA